MDRLRIDAIHVLRSFRARPGATAAIVAVLTLGIGVTATMFALADPYLLRPLPYRDPGRLVVMRAAITPSTDGQPRVIPSLDDWRARTDVFEDVAGYGEMAERRVQTPQGAAILRTTPVSENFFDVLGVPFTARGQWDARADGGVRPFALLASRGGLTPLGAAADIEGETFRATDGAGLHVVDVLPPDFLFPVPRSSRRPDALVPFTFRDTIVLEPGRTSYVTGIGRLRADVSVAAAGAAMASGAGGGVNVTVEELPEFMTKSLRALAWGALAAGLLIALACGANVVNLQVARSVYRTREFATREAIGAGRLDLVRLITLEVAGLAVMGAVGGLLAANFALALASQVIPAEYTHMGEARVTLRVVILALLLAAAVVATGCAAAWATWRASRAGGINEALSAEARRVRLTRLVMATGQSAIAVILLTGGVLLVRSYVNLWSQDTGFSRHAAIVSVAYPVNYPAPRLAEDVDAALAAIRRLPGVEAAAATTGPLLDDSMSIGGTLMRVAGRGVLFQPKQVTPGYFAAIGATPRSGRVLDAGDRNWKGLVVNEAFVRRFWPGQPPSAALGQPVMLHIDGRIRGEIVGVVPNAHERALDRPPVPAMYRLFEAPQSNLPYHFVIRIRPGMARPDAAAIRAVRAATPDASIVDVAWLHDRLAGTVKDRSFATLILGLFAAAGLGVTASGLFAIVAFTVARRTREIAIRRAIGAEDRHIMRLIVREAAASATIGAFAGLVAAGWLSKFLESYLYGVAANDTASMTMVAVSMVMIVMLAAWMPARRALRLAPSTALRVD